MPEAEIHVAWMLRDYKEQNSVNDFEKLSADQRRAAVVRVREGLIEKCKKARDAKGRKSLEKNFKNTEPYTHLTLAERTRFVYELAKKIKGWRFARLFAVIVDKKKYTPPKPEITPLSQAFERIVTKVENYLKHISFDNSKEYGLLIHDECETAAATHIKNMRRYFRQGTFKSRITHIIETPLFVASEQTNMIQIADLCAYALRRYYDYGENDLYDIIKERADRAHDENIGFDHYTSAIHCPCEICRSHRKKRK